MGEFWVKKVILDIVIKLSIENKKESGAGGKESDGEE